MPSSAMAEEHHPSDAPEAHRPFLSSATNPKQRGSSFRESSHSVANTSDGPAPSLFDSIDAVKFPFTLLRYAYCFDGKGSFYSKEWDLSLPDKPGTFSWYHIEIPRTCKSLSAGAMAIIEYLYPHLSIQEITTLVSNGPFCGTLFGSLVFRINSAGPLQSEYTLRIAARVTETSVISVSLGRIPRLEFARTIAKSSGFFSEVPNQFALLGVIEPVGGSKRRNAEAEDQSLISPGLAEGGSFVVNEELLEDLLRRNHPQDADNPIPISVAQLLVHIIDTFVDQLQDMVVDVEMRLDELERSLDGSGDAHKRQFVQKRIFPLMHLDLQRILQAVAHGEVVFPKVKDKVSGKKLCSTEDLTALETMMSRLRRNKENVGFLATRITALQASLDQWQADQINKKLYYLSFLSMVFLPISTITGLFGMNVGGVPWVPQTTTDAKDLGGFMYVMYICFAIIIFMLVAFAASPLYAFVTTQADLAVQRIRKLLKKTRRVARMESEKEPNDDIV
eukprot:TRINITY_DN32415_c0_g1_i1.p1 TRINITY_DN32415_c0_g1~~TRINITY_DN32415_c0_g1_i1.p1  ORF type:complete len:505 (-),score=55.83 TRINITY_DN32415_c0_g1_i1:567-2081(-)